MKDLAISFAYHEWNEVTNQNYNSFALHNPEADIYKTCFSALDPGLPSALLKAMEPCVNDGYSAWYYADLLLYAAFVSSKVEYSKWLLVEWDVYCAMPVAEFFRETWSFDFVAPSIRTPSRESEWIWFDCIQQLPEHLQAHAYGIVPIACTLFSMRALEAIVTEFLKHPFNAISELRLGTLGQATGYSLVANPRSNAISWRAMDEQRADRKLSRGIHHPIKYII